MIFLESAPASLFPAVKSEIAKNAFLIAPIFFTLTQSSKKILDPSSL